MNSIVINPRSLSTINSQLDMILLDGSGSMQDKWWPMLEAIDTYVGTLKTAQVDSHIILDVFDDHDKQLNMRDTHISGWKTFAEEPIGARWGFTPLYDAIALMGAKLRDINPTKGCAITIVTDGDNTSYANKFATLETARAILDWCRAQSWSVTFIGCDFDNDRQARALGANASNSIGVQKLLLKDAAKAYGEKRVRNARTGDDISFNPDEKTKFGGLLGYTGTN